MKEKIGNLREKIKLENTVFKIVLKYLDKFNNRVEMAEKEEVNLKVK